MPFIVTHCFFPIQLADKVAQRYLETMQKLPIPDVIKRIAPPSSVVSRKGVETIIVDDVKLKDMGDAWEYLNRFLIEFRDIEGFNYERDIHDTVAESLKLIGMD